MLETVMRWLLQTFLISDVGTILLTALACIYPTTLFVNISQYDYVPSDGGGKGIRKENGGGDVVLPRNKLC